MRNVIRPDDPNPERSNEAAGRAFLMGLAVTLRAFRADQGLSVRELSVRSGVSERFVVELEAGRANPSLLRLRALAHALGSSVSELVTSAEGVANEPATETRPQPGFVVLLGLRGAGKSTVGSQAAARMGVPFVELDERIERRTGLATGAIFELHGTSYYRRIEREALEELLAEGGPAIAATAGSIVTDHATFEFLSSNAATIWLRASPEDHFARVLAQGDTRPMANRADAMNELRSLLRARGPLYERAEHTVDTSKLGLSRSIDRVERIARRAFAARAMGRPKASRRGPGT
jgi:XRE family aerobic/anaerobic benzoate catabolism transcriptional regulator